MEWGKKSSLLLVELSLEKISILGVEFSKLSLTRLPWTKLSK
jgi:hypothetical protein